MRSILRTVFVAVAFAVALVPATAIAQSASISGTVFTDVNRNGVLNVGEPGFANVTVNLDAGADGSVDASTTSSVTGAYSFPNLGPGTYRVRIVPPAGFVQTSANPADIVVSQPVPTTGVDFGLAPAPAAVPAASTAALLGLAFFVGVAGARLIRYS